jgi:hypothetical protein
MIGRNASERHPVSVRMSAPRRGSATAAGHRIVRIGTWESLARYLNEGFLAYLRHDPLPQPRIVHRLYPSPSGG